MRKTLGEKLIDAPKSGDDRLNKANKLYAELIDIINEVHQEKIATKFAVIDEHSLDESVILNIIYTNALAEILNAQMNTTKLLTLKY